MPVIPAVVIWYAKVFAIAGTVIYSQTEAPCSPGTIAKPGEVCYEANVSPAAVIPDPTLIALDKAAAYAQSTDPRSMSERYEYECSLRYNPKHKDKNSVLDTVYSKDRDKRLYDRCLHNLRQWQVKQ